MMQKGNAEQQHSCLQTFGKAARKTASRACKEALSYTGMRKYCVLWVQGGRECRSPWFYSRERAHQAKEIMKSKFGAAIVYVD